MDELNKEMKRLIGALNGAGYEVVSFVEYGSPRPTTYELRVRRPSQDADDYEARLKQALDNITRDQRKVSFA